MNGPQLLSSLQDAQLKSVVSAILQVGAERNKTIERLKLALVEGRDDDALQMARRLCGLQEVID